jgi:hypothetical protein
MWYAGYESTGHSSNRFGRAFSQDGINWIRDAANPLIFPENDYTHPFFRFGQANNWEALDINRPSILFEDGRRRIWFTGTGYLPGSYGASGITSQIGYAEEARAVFLPIVLK